MPPEAARLVLMATANAGGCFLGCKHLLSSLLLVILLLLPVLILLPRQIPVTKLIYTCCLLHLLRVRFLGVAITAIHAVQAASRVARCCNVVQAQVQTGDTKYNGEWRFPEPRQQEAIAILSTAAPDHDSGLPQSLRADLCSFRQRESNAPGPVANKGRMRELEPVKVEAPLERKIINTSVARRNGS